MAGHHYELRPDPAHRLPDPAYRLWETERLTLMPEGPRLRLERRTATGTVLPAPDAEEAVSEPRCPVRGAGD